MFAVLNIHKPLEMTSHDVISRLRKIYSLKKIGHLGTLDPLAEGVLPVCLGQATRLIEYYPSDKRYRAKVTLGRTTTTLDRAGEEVMNTDCQGLELSPERLESLLGQFRGVIQQEVPLYSAVHVAGKKLYQLAYAGKTADLPRREATIHELILQQVDVETDPGHPSLTLDIHCGSGTYIRSLARDIGDRLGVGAYLSALTRTAHGRFLIEDSVSLEALQESPSPASFLQDPLKTLAMPQLRLPSPEVARLLMNGMKVDEKLLASPPELKIKPNAFYLALHENVPVGVVQAVSGRLKPVKIFPQA